MEHLFVVNPIAGKGRALSYIPKIEEIFKNKGDKYFIEISKGPGHASQIARDYCGKGIYRIYAVGGDGTLNEVLNGMAESKSSLAVIPSGSGNDFIKSITNDLDIKTILERTIEGREENIDIARVNNKYFINITSIGFDGKVAYNANKFKKIWCIPERFCYFIGIATTLLEHSSNLVKVSIGKEIFDIEILLIVAANGKYYGGGIMPAPQAKIDDGELDICIIEKKGLFEIIKFLPRFIKGKHGNIDGVSFLKTTKIKIKSEKDIALNIDGDVSMTKEVNLEIIPKGLKMIIPK